MLNNSSKKIINAKAALDSLYKTDNENIINNESEIDIIRNLFDDIIKLRKRRIKLECIYQSLVDSGINITFSNFTTALSRIRKERGIEIRKRSSNKVKITTPLSNLKNENKSKSNLDKPKEDVTLIDENFISPLAEKDRSHYTSDDFKKEWSLVQNLLDQNREDKFKQYQILNRNMSDIEGLNPKTLNGVIKLSEIVGTAEMNLHQRYKDLINLTRK